MSHWLLHKGKKNQKRIHIELPSEKGRFICVLESLWKGLSVPSSVCKCVCKSVCNSVCKSVRPSPCPSVRPHRLFILLLRFQRNINQKLWPCSMMTHLFAQSSIVSFCQQSASFWQSGFACDGIRLAVVYQLVSWVATVQSWAIYRHDMIEHERPRTWHNRTGKNMRFYCS